ncbi:MULTISPECIES: hydrogenase-2 assembly chaperone [Providencia]|uniref:hydrogenase-2 assembly chaperone n=1 Tax=Providencia TaxID=586 RepID=UPI000839A946|nr:MULTISPECIES: hydrogenase-2 assembly chaperone [Providencia]MBP6122945.1 hydrogenase-2 assembly chaperone [Providencia sp.]NIH23810.1 hydrogenase-2 assembly chaperone [Providencia heimbachae]
MSDEIKGYAQDPRSLVQAAFERVSEQSMHDLSFLHPSMQVYASEFALFENQWVGAVITPWMLTAMILPGPEQYWSRRTVGEKLGLILPYGEMTYTVGELEGLTQYLACSLMSPLDRKLRAEQGQHLADDCRRILLSLPVTDPNVPQAPERRALFTRYRGEL